MYINIYMVFSCLNIFLCLAQLFTEKDVPSMIVEAMFAIIFYITFLFDGSDDDYEGM